MIYPLHPLAQMFPLIEGRNLEDMIIDIDLHGVREPVTLFHGQIVDGQNRQYCLTLANKRRAERSDADSTPWPLPTNEWDGKGSLVEFVWSRNVHRRHMEEHQRVMFAARAAPMLEEEARQRQLANLRHQPSLAPNGANEKTSGKVAEQAAKMTGVSTRQVEKGLKVIRQGVPQLVAAVDARQISISAAADIVKATTNLRGRDRAREQLRRIKAQGRRAKSIVQEIDLQDDLERWAKVVAKLQRQIQACETPLPKVIKACAALAKALKEAARSAPRLIKAPHQNERGLLCQRAQLSRG